MIIRQLKKTLKLPIQVIKNYRVKSALTRLTSHGHPKVKAIAEALNETLTDSMSAEERKRISQIELRRSFLLRSNKEIAVIDYGAGSKGSIRTKEEMEKGVRSTALVADVSRASKSAFWATFLFKLIRKLEPLSCVELGSCVGISAAYQAAGLNLNGKGHLITLEGSPEIARIAEETMKSLKLKNASVVTGPFQKTLKGVLKSSEPVDFFFDDGHHDHDATIQYFHEALPYLADEALVIFDDISWSAGMKQAWTEIENNARVAVSIDLKTIGIALIRDNLASKEKFRIPL